MKWLPPEVVTPADFDPVLMGQAREFLRVDGNDQDATILGLVKAAAAHVEAATGLRMGTQTLHLHADQFDNRMRLPAAPIQSIISVEYVDPSGEVQVVPSETYEEQLLGKSPFIAPRSGYSWPTPAQGAQAVTVKAVAGFGGINDIPEDIRLAMLLIVAHLFDNRTTDTLPGAVTALLANHRVWGFGA